MNELKKSFVILGLSVMNILHSSLHIVQVIQSLLLFSSSVEEHHSDGIEALFHNPIFAIIWASIGLFTFYIGLKDFIHHKKCKHES